MKFRILLSVLFCCCAARAFAQQVLRTVNGAAGERLGAVMIDAGDQNADGYVDVLVGAPGFNGGRGAVHCISGKYLATGNSPSVLSTITAASLNAGAAFGTSLVEIGNLTGDTASDFIVGAPNYVPTGAFDTRGAIFLVDGSTHAVVTFIHGLPQTHFGQVMVCVGDQTGDYKSDIAVSAPEIFLNLSTVHIVPSSAFGFSTALATIPHVSWSGSREYGAALASGFDYDGDGWFDVAIGGPDYGSNLQPDSGWVDIRSAHTQFGFLGAYAPWNTGERFGSSIDANEDYDGDGFIDLVVGAPGWSAGTVKDGRVVIVSGAKLSSTNPPPGPYELHSITVGFSSTIFDLNFGAAVRACGDLNHDGVRDILAGAPSLEFRHRYAASIAGQSRSRSFLRSR